MSALAGGELSPALTTDFVLDETLTMLRRRGAKATSIVDVAESVVSSSLISIVYVDESLFREALSKFRKYERLSFTDAVTLTVMNRYRVREIYSHDRDFDLEGIVRKERP